MKQFWLLIPFVLASGTALAAGTGDATGVNKRGQRFVVAPNEGPALGDHDSYEVQVIDDEGTSIYVDQPCRFRSAGPGGEPYEFSCSSQGTSPLAGVAFSVDAVRRDCIWATYICKSGCSAEVPGVLHESYWECPDDEP